MSDSTKPQKHVKVFHGAKPQLSDIKPLKKAPEMKLPPDQTRYFHKRKWAFDADIKPHVIFDQETNSLLCDDPEFIPFLELITNGAAAQMRHFVTSKKARIRMLSDDGGWIRAKLMAYLMTGELTNEKVGRILELVKLGHWEATSRLKKDYYAKSAPKQAATGQSTQRVKRDILGMAKEGEEPGSQEGP